MYVDNPLEDINPPEYVPGTIAMRSFVSDDDPTVQVIRVTWSFKEDTELVQGRCDAHFIAALRDTYSYSGSGPYDDDVCTADRKMPNYMPSSTYSTVRLRMHDIAGNTRHVRFTGDDATEPPPTVDLITTNPDTDAPEVDINRIRVNAEPTNPGAPNGETRVTVSLRYRDNISGVKIGGMYLRDPQGGTHHHHIYVEGDHLLYPEGDPNTWQSLSRRGPPSRRILAGNLGHRRKSG